MPDCPCYQFLCALTKDVRLPTFEVSQYGDFIEITFNGSGSMRREVAEALMGLTAPSFGFQPPVYLEEKSTPESQVYRFSPAA